jgi:hypothetical protein
MTGSFHPKDLLTTLAAYVGLLLGLLLFGAYPLVGVLLALGSMALLLRSVASLCGAQKAASEGEAKNDARA